MTRFSLFFVVLILALLFGCKQNNIEFKITNKKEFGDIPSGSGMAKIGDYFYIIGDDSPFLFVLDSSLTIMQQIPLTDTFGYDGGRIPKKQKLDFEALERINEYEIIIFGSGSKSPGRDIMILVNLEDSISYNSYPITFFYDFLRRLPEMANAELNIEAAAFWNGNLSLFNRSNNLIFTFDYDDLIQSIKSNNLPKLKHIISCDLPSLNNITSGFSGAEGLPNENVILFTSSVEGHKNSYDDGKIFGSFIGILRINDDKVDYQNEITQIPNKGTPLKIESVTVTQLTDYKNLGLTLITDNDDGTSIIIQGVLKNSLIQN